MQVAVIELVQHSCTMFLMLSMESFCCLQGIPWDRMQFSREHYRVRHYITLLWSLLGCCFGVLDSSSCIQDTRLEDYRNYLNLKDEVDAHQDELYQECLAVQKVLALRVPLLLLQLHHCAVCGPHVYYLPAISTSLQSCNLLCAQLGTVLSIECWHVQDSQFFDFCRNSRSVKSTIVHFQVQLHVALNSLTTCAVEHGRASTHLLLQRIYVPSVHLPNCLCVLLQVLCCMCSAACYQADTSFKSQVLCCCCDACMHAIPCIVSELACVACSCEISSGPHPNMICISCMSIASSIGVA